MFVIATNLTPKLRFRSPPPICAVQRNTRLFLRPGLAVQQRRSLFTYFRFVLIRKT